MRITSARAGTLHDGVGKKRLRAQGLGVCVRRACVDQGCTKLYYSYLYLVGRVWLECPHQATRVSAAPLMYECPLQPRLGDGLTASLRQRLSRKRFDISELVCAPAA